ncbi:hypothetical protein AY606_02275 [Acinetobacter sp. SFB]|uniref:hypothetical protein n=1 Tax=Acinetobacter sp. SFB TaxID=1805634 RepID=UPI0007D82DC9|nr:hypothetical protein [Acinetobacter sp. SFB]OAL81580.1 hypothetical protein AY606_02275 [Acinetobacter sp. SFB]
MKKPVVGFKPIYLDKVLMGRGCAEEPPQLFHEIAQANQRFIIKLNAFKQLIDCLSGDKVFLLRISDTEELLQHSEENLRQLAHGMHEQHFIEQHSMMAGRILDLAGRITKAIGNMVYLKRQINSLMI